MGFGLFDDSPIPSQRNSTEKPSQDKIEDNLMLDDRDVYLSGYSDQILRYVFVFVEVHFFVVFLKCYPLCFNVSFYYTGAVIILNLC